MSSTTTVAPSNNENWTCDLVISRFKENLDWLSQYNQYNFRNLYLYNKGDKNVPVKCALNTKDCIQESLPNIGRCDHTYLYHIIKHYDNLADVTVFTKGSSKGERERRKLTFTLQQVFKTKDTVMSVSEHHVPINIHAATFGLDEYRGANPENHVGIFDEEGKKMQPAKIRPFGKWYEQHFPDISTTKAVYAGVFSVSKAHIHQRTKEYYQNLIKELEPPPNDKNNPRWSNPEAGHFFERAWVAVFKVPDGVQPNGKQYLYNDFMENMLGGRRKQKGRGTRRKRLKRRSYKR